MRRSGGTIGVTVHFTSTMARQTKKEEFLSNKHNKQRFIAMLSQRLEQARCRIHQVRGDADFLIVQTALTSASKQEIVLVGTIQICLCSSSIMQRTSGITYSSDLKLDGRVRREIDAGTSLQCEPFLEGLSLTTLCSCIPFLCVYGLGKKLSISKFKSDSQFQDQVKVLMSQGANKDDIISAGETALVCPYNGNPHHGNNVLRYDKFCVKAATSTVPV